MIFFLARSPYSNETFAQIRPPLVIRHQWSITEMPRIMMRLHTAVAFMLDRLWREVHSQVQVSLELQCGQLHSRYVCVCRVFEQTTLASWGCFGWFRLRHRQDCTVGLYVPVKAYLSANWFALLSSPYWTTDCSSIDSICLLLPTFGHWHTMVLSDQSDRMAKRTNVCVGCIVCRTVPC